MINLGPMELLRQFVEAVDKHAVRLESARIGNDDPELGCEPHSWHSEWLHHVRQVLAGTVQPSGRPDQPATSASIEAAARSDLQKLDAVVHVLGIEDSEDDPSEVCRQIMDSNEELRQRAEEAEAALSAQPTAGEDCPECGRQTRIDRSIAKQLGESMQINASLRQQLDATLVARQPNQRGERAMLKAAFDAISTLPIGVFGFANDDNGSWPIRDELLERIEKVLAAQPEREGK